MSAPALRPRTPPATPHQRLYIRTLMSQLDLDTRYMSALHRRFFDAARIAQPEPNAQIDPVLCALTMSQAGALITALKQEAGDEQ